MTTARERPGHPAPDTRGTPASPAPARPAREQRTEPLPLIKALMAGHGGATRPMRGNGAPEPVRGNGAPEPVRGDEATERMRGDEAGASPPPRGTTEPPAGQEALAPAYQDTRRARPAATPAPAPVQSGPGTRIGQYELIRPLGRGGMGEVHLARDLRLGRLAAIKRLHAPGPGLAERFLREARTTARCTHENIVVIYEVGEDVEHGGDPYMALEYIEGQTLRQWLREHAAAAGEQAPVPPGRAVELMLPVVRALAYAHARGIVHRDLKPENVMLTRSGAIKVLDFGIAKLLSAPRPEGEGGDGVPDGAVDLISGRVSGPAAMQSSVLAGTLPYMSPEQMNEGLIDRRSDIWTAGIMLFELVCGRHPIAGRSLGDFLRVADQDEPMPGVLEAMPHAGPEMGPLAGIIDRCLLKNPQHRTPSARTLLAELEALAPGRRAALVGDDGNPFAGLAAFQEADADRFFGRDRDIDHVVIELRSRPLVAVVGPSGAGKSSLVRAGVIPALKRSGEGWDAHVVRPGREPLAALAALLAQTHSSAIDTGDTGPSIDSSGDDASAALDDSAASAVLGPLADRMRAEPGYLGARLRARATSKLRRIIVFVDQLEELYTLGASPDERAAFLACLAAMADDAASPLRVIVSMRSDFLDRVTEDRRADRRFGAEVTRGLVLLPAMDRDGMRQALLRPVEAAEYRFESPAMVDRMVEALAATPGALPLLQFTAARLWELRDTGRRLLTEHSYERLGGVAGALATHADAVLAGMSSARQAVARAVLERLVTPERTRALVSVAELRVLHLDPGTVDELVQHLAAMRLVVIERGAEGEEHIVELVHESLIDRWPTLARWLSENHEDAAMLARLRGAARDWERGGRAAGLLWTGEAAAEARAWQQRYRGELSPVERRYLDAVLAAAARARRVRRRLVGGLLAVATAVAVAMSWLAWEQARARQEAAAMARQEAEARQAATKEAAKAEQEAARARDATRMAALRTMAADPTTQMALVREIEDTDSPPPGAVDEAKRLLHASVARVVFTDHDHVVWSASFSPDGRQVVSASRDKTVRVWNADGRGAPIVLRGHDDEVRSASFSPDGRQVVSASSDKTVRVWNANGRGAPIVLRGHDDEVRSACFSPDGQQVVSASKDKTVRVWKADGRGVPIVLRGHDGSVFSASFSPDGQQVVSASSDETVRVWKADGRGVPIVLRGHDDDVRSASFSPDGQQVVSASSDKTVRVWNANGRGAPIVLRGHDGAVRSASFSPDGQQVVSASSDKTVRVWNADGRGVPIVLRGHEEELWSASFSPDGQQVVSASWDQTVRVWNAESIEAPRLLQGHDAPVDMASFSPDGQQVVSASRDKTVRVWNANGRGAPIVLRGHDDGVKSASFSPDGRQVVSASSDKTVRVWNANGRGAPIVLRGHDDGVKSASFSPDGRQVVSASSDKTVRVWNANGRGAPIVLRGHDELVWSASFSPDGRQVVSASRDKTVRVWNANGRGAPIVLRGHDDVVWSASFSPDGQQVISASRDKTVRVWNANGRGAPIVLRGHDDWVSWAELSPDGQHIVSASKDKSIRIWRSDGTGGPVVLIGHEQWVNAARFSLDGRRVVSASDDGTVRVWHDLAPVTLDDPRLWTVTSYCMPVARRVELLGVSEQMARRDLRRCQERVAGARRGLAAVP